MISAHGCLCFHPEKRATKNDLCKNIILSFYEVCEKLKQFKLYLVPKGPMDDLFHAKYEFDRKTVFILIHFDKSSIWNSKWLSGIKKIRSNSEVHLLLVHNNFLRIWKLNSEFFSNFAKSPRRFEYGPRDENGTMYSAYALPFDLGEAYL